MTIQKKEDVKDRGMSATLVAEYLKSNDDFFEQHPEVLRSLEITHQSGGAVSLIERQVQVLRTETRQLRNRIRELVDIAKENDQLMSKLHVVSMEMVRAHSVGEYLKVLQESLKNDFSADAVSVRLVGDFRDAKVGAFPEIVTAQHAGLSFFDSILARGKPVCGRFNKQQLEFMFDDKAEEMKSVAVVPLGTADKMGFFAVGSLDPERFRAGMSTTFLANLGEMASVVLSRFR